MIPTKGAEDVGGSGGGMGDFETPTAVKKDARYERILRDSAEFQVSACLWKSEKERPVSTVSFS